jgi:hypothetical protein
MLIIITILLYFFCFIFFFTDATTLLGSGAPHGPVLVLWKFCNSIFFWGGFVNPTFNPKIWRTTDYTSSGPYSVVCVTWVSLPGAYAPASITLRVTGARKPPLHGRAVVLEEVILMCWNQQPTTNYRVSKMQCNKNRNNTIMNVIN